jgi:hypothetical protein
MNRCILNIPSIILMTTLLFVVFPLAHGPAWAVRLTFPNRVKRENENLGQVFIKCPRSVEGIS